MSITKNVLNEKKKIPIIFDIEIDFEFWHILIPPHYTYLQNSIISFWYVEF